MLMQQQQHAWLDFSVRCDAWACRCSSASELVVNCWFQPVDGNADCPNTGLTPLLDRKTPQPRCRFSLIVVSGRWLCDGWFDVWHASHNCTAVSLHDLCYSKLHVPWLSQRSVFLWFSHFVMCLPCRRSNECCRTSVC